MSPEWRAQQGQMYFWKYPGPAQRYYLAALESLAAVCLHQNRAGEHAEIMAKLAELGARPERHRAVREHRAA
jgi:hypothetical protein